MAKIVDILRNRISDLRIKESKAKHAEEKKDIMKIRKSNEAMLLELMRGKWSNK